jgi:sporulation protein YlmC with PRC-barrel domain
VKKTACQRELEKAETTVHGTRMKGNFVHRFIPGDGLQGSIQGKGKKMKKTIYVSALAAGCSLLFAAGGIAAEQKSQTQQQREQAQQQERQGQQQARQQQQSQYAQQLMTAKEIEGMKVQNRQGEEIGSVDKVVLDSQDGQIAYVVVSSGGFWGMGGEKAVIPWKAVQLQQEQDEPVLMVDVTKDQLKNAPQGDIEEITDRRQAEEIHQYYGVAPYWEGQEGQQQQMQPMQQMQQKEQQQQQMEEQQQRR